MGRWRTWVALGGLLMVSAGCEASGRGAEVEARIVSLAVVPGDQVLARGDRLRLALVARYSDGTVRDLRRSARWESTGHGVVRLTPNGVVSAMRRGAATIRATIDTHSATTRVRVGARSIGPLRVSRVNPRYFVDRLGRVLYLAGAHTWGNLIDSGTVDPPPRFDYAGYLDFLQVHELWMFRLWAWEQGSGSNELQRAYYFSPTVYRRIGPGLALDGKPKFDLTQLNRDYFRRMRERVTAARERGLYVIVMLFDGWSIELKGRPGRNPWLGHPFNAGNNVNGVDGDPGRNGDGRQTHTLASPKITRLQEAYVARVLDAVGDQPNVLYEISNESSAGSLPWQNHFVDFIRAHEGRGRAHPVGITAEWPGGTNGGLLGTRADWIAPNVSRPDPTSGGKVVIADTDHLCGVCGDPGFPWRAMTRGLNPLFMDPYDGKATGLGALDEDYRESRWETIRRRLGVTQHLGARLDFSRLEPRADLSSTRFCLADARRGGLYLVYAARGGVFAVDLSRSRRRLSVEWIDPDTGASSLAGAVEGGAWRIFTAPGHGDAVLLLREAK